MIFKFIEIEENGVKIPLFFGSFENVEKYKENIEKIKDKKWNGNGKIEQFKKKFKLKKIKEINGESSRIRTYKSKVLEFSIIEIKRTTDVYELLDFLEKDDILEYLICKRKNMTIYYILEKK